MSLTQRGYSVGQFEFTIDGIGEPFYLKSFEGGLAKGNVVEEALGTGVELVKHISTVDIEPMSIELGMQDSLPILGWIQKSWKMQYERKNGHLLHADFGMKTALEYKYYNALLTEVTFPALDAVGKDAAQLKVKMQPETIALVNGDNNRLRAQAVGASKEKLWNVSCFQFELEGHDVSMVSKIDSFTVKQGVKAYHTGRDRYAHWEPTKLTFPDLAIYLSAAHSSDTRAWYQKMIDGAKDPSMQTTGAIKFLAPNKRDVVFEIHLAGVGIKSWTIDKSERQDQPKRVKIELFISSMELKMSGTLAFQATI